MKPVRRLTIIYSIKMQLLVKLACFTVLRNCELLNLNVPCVGQLIRSARGPCTVHSNVFNALTVASFTEALTGTAAKPKHVYLITWLTE